MVSGLRCCEKIVMLSAWERIWVSGGVGLLCIHRLKMLSERTNPCGTPIMRSLVVDGVSFCNVCAYHPVRQCASHLL